MFPGVVLCVIFVCLGTSLGNALNEVDANKGASTRIVGGVEAREHEYPFIVSLYRGSVPIIGHFCGGSIIEPSWILTAAHCVSQPDFKLVAGKHDLRKNEGMQQTVSIEAVISHPEYNPRTFENDLALVKVTPPFTYTDHVKSFQIPNTDFVATGLVTTAGWGVTEESSSVVSPVLRKVTVNALPNSACASKYGNEFHMKKMICAGITSGGKDACQGDSGGPLLCDDHRFGDTVCGVVSFGHGCARPEYAGVYTKVAFFSDWIHEAMERYGKTEVDKPKNPHTHYHAPRPTGIPVTHRRTKRPRRGNASAISAELNTALTTVALVVIKMFQY